MLDEPSDVGLLLEVGFDFEAVLSSGVPCLDVPLDNPTAVEGPVDVGMLGPVVTLGPVDTETLGPEDTGTLGPVDAGTLKPVEAGMLCEFEEMPPVLDVRGVLSDLPLELELFVEEALLEDWEFVEIMFEDSDAMEWELT